jgi:hypothetical protein
MMCVLDGSYSILGNLGEPLSIYLWTSILDKSYVPLDLFT